MSNSHPRKAAIPAKQRGFMSLDVMGGVLMSIGLLAASGAVWHFVNKYLDATTVATQTQVVGRGMSRYAEDNRNQLLAESAGGRTAVRTLAQVRAAGAYIPSGIGNVNVFGQTYELRVARGSSGADIEPIVVAVGGQAMSTWQTGVAARSMSGRGGYIANAGTPCGAIMMSQTTICGAGLQWQRTAAAYQAGIGALQGGRPAYAAFLDTTNRVEDYLYRNRVPGNPSLTTMETYLQLGNAATAWEGSPCYAASGDASSGMLRDGAIGKSPTGVLLSCQGSVWRTQGKSLLERHTWFATAPGDWIKDYGDICQAQLDAGGMAADGWIATGSDACSEDGEECTSDGVRCFAIRLR
ncbi:shufflon system plasmid conjugative transfer pilus tip adhesin PilV [Achromobacter ruhlandii]|uniref:shufflon system plasmid conjugative transfer pilus tip adhesin PilV n=1 Tax=Achromobacter ruhlandii TaxID=72557 RepID=UPI003BA2C1F8